MTAVRSIRSFLSPRDSRFICLSIIVFVLHLSQACTQEFIFRLEQIRQYSCVFTLNQFIYYAIFAYLHWRMKGKGKCCVPTGKLALIGFLSTGTMSLSNAAVAHLNYPTHLMFKSCKLIPVMIGSVLIVGKRYNPLNVLACILMTVGVIFFTLGDCKVQPRFETIGVLFVCLALCFDATVGNYQEKLFKEYPFLTKDQMVFYSYTFGAFYLFIFELIKAIFAESNFFQGIHFFNQNIFRTYLLIGVYSITGYLGVIVILTMIKDFGALLTATVTTMRKVLTIVLSFWMFPKPFTVQYLWSGLLVLAGICTDICEKHLQLYDKLRTIYEQTASIDSLKKPLIWV